mgnify:CR=1 FL=1
MSELTIHGFETSNNFKVRVALGFKGIPYRFRSIDPKDRSEILRLSKQHLTPVLEHGAVVVFDSAAILRYLDANFEGPTLFGRSHAEQWEIEDWEFFARTVLAGPMMEVVHKRLAGTPLDAEGIARCTQSFDDACAQLSVALGGREWLVGDQISAADVTAAPVLRRIQASNLIPWPASAGPLQGWIERVMAYDGLSRLAD